jgi:hypothetical protein
LPGGRKAHQETRKASEEGRKQKDEREKRITGEKDESLE